MKKYLVTALDGDICECGNPEVETCDELPPDARVLTKSEFVQKFMQLSESPYAKEEAHELWAALDKKNKAGESE